MKNQTLTAVMVVTAALLFTPMTKAQSVFGNTPTDTSNFAILTLYPDDYSTGWAVSFTPTVAFDFSSVTLWLSNYTTGFGLQLWQANNPINYVNFGASSPALGNSAEAAYTFTPTFSVGIHGLQANQTYYLVAYSSVSATTTVDWVSGTAPTGDAVFNATYLEGDGAVQIRALSDSTAPAFTFNAVPEPSTLGLLAVGAGALLMRQRR